MDDTPMIDEIKSNNIENKQNNLNLPENTNKINTLSNILSQPDNNKVIFKPFDKDNVNKVPEYDQPRYSATIDEISKL